MMKKMNNETIKRNVKSLFAWAGQLETSLKSLAVLLYASRRRTAAHRLAGSCAGSCWVLGNGPSLRATLEAEGTAWFRGQDTWMVNDAVLSDWYAVLRPSRYVLADPSYFDQRLPVIPGYSDPERTFDALNRKTQWPVCLFVPAGVLHRLHAHVTNPHITLCGYNATSFEGFNALRLLFYRCGLAMPHPWNVLVAAIYLAVHLGYREVNVLGAEHSWLRNLHVTDRNEVALVNEHFYDSGNVAATVWKKCDGSAYLLHETLADQSCMFASYWQLEDYARRRGCAIFNCTPGSFIDAFERKIIQ
jgi:hypothetical protein